MALLDWKPEYSVGNPAIDYEHQQMIRQINAVHEQLSQQADSTMIDALLGEIHADISAHFALEERLMRAANYGEYEAHKEDHEELLEQIRALMEIYTDNPQTGQHRLQQQLSDWFSHHFATFDAHLYHQLTGQ